MSDTLNLQSLLALFAGFFAFASGVAKFFQLEDPAPSSLLPYVGRYIEAIIATAAGGVVVVISFTTGHVPVSAVWILGSLFAILLLTGFSVYQYRRVRARRARSQDDSPN